MKIEIIRYALLFPFYELTKRKTKYHLLSDETRVIFRPERILIMSSVGSGAIEIHGFEIQRKAKRERPSKRETIFDARLPCDASEFFENVLPSKIGSPTMLPGDQFVLTVLVKRKRTFRGAIHGASKAPE